MYIVGIDETGRGSLIGPIFIVGVGYDIEVFERVKHYFKDFKDSKKLSRYGRENLVKKLKNYIYDEDLNFKIKVVIYDNIQIDKQGIHKLNIKGIKEVINKFKQEIKDNDLVIYVDGNFYNEKGVKSIIKGDAKIKAISIASVIAKVIRDRYILHLVDKNPELEKYNIRENMGYPTIEHLEIIKKEGITRFHRISFVKEYLKTQRKLF